MVRSTGKRDKRAGGDVQARKKLLVRDSNSALQFDGKWFEAVPVRLPSALEQDLWFLLVCFFTSSTGPISPRLRPFGADTFAPCEVAHLWWHVR